MNELLFGLVAFIAEGATLTAASAISATAALMFNFFVDNGTYYGEERRAYKHHHHNIEGAHIMPPYSFSFS